MAMEEIIARLGLDSSTFKQGLEQSEGGVNKFKTALNDMAGKVAAAFSVGALISFAKEAVEHAAAMKDSAAATRTGAEEYQALAAVVRTSGAEVAQLDRGLTNLITRTEEANSGNKKLQSTFALLNVDLQTFTALPSERKIEAIGQAYIAAGRSQEAYAAVVDLLGARSGPKLIETLEKLGTEGFDELSRKAEEAGLVLNKFDQQKLTAIQDEFKNFKVQALVFTGEVLSSFDRLFRFINGSSREQIYFEDIDPARAAARVAAITQLIEEKWAAHLERMESLGSQRNPYYDEAAKRAAIVRDINEDEAGIQARIISILDERNQREAVIAEQTRHRAEQLARESEIHAMLEGNLSALKMLEDGRAVLRLKSLSDAERLVELEKQHVAAAEVLSNMSVLGEGTEAQKREIVKNVLDLEKQIADTKGKIAADEKKANDERGKTEEKLLDLLKERASIQAKIDQAAYNEYGRTTGEIAAGGGGSTLAFEAQEAERLAGVAQRQFDELSRARARAANNDQDAQRELARLEQQFNDTEANRRSLENSTTKAQGGEVKDDHQRLTEIRDEIKRLNEKLQII